MDESRRAYEARQSRRTALESQRERFIGLTPDEASNLAARLAIEYRIIDLDQAEWHTGELRDDRLTLDVKDGRVAGARVA